MTGLTNVITAPLPRSVVALCVSCLISGGKQQFGWGRSHGRAVHSLSLNHISLHSHSYRERFSWRYTAPERGLKYYSQSFLATAMDIWYRVRGFIQQRS